MELGRIKFEFFFLQIKILEKFEKMFKIFEEILGELVKK